MRGRKPKSLTELKEKGTYRKARHGHLRGAPNDLPPISTEPPDCLDDYGRAEWTRVIESVAPGHLTAADAGVLTMYASSYGTYLLATAKLHEEGLFSKRKVTSAGGEKGTEKDTPSRWYRIARESSADAMRCATLLGITPVDRNRVKGVKSPRTDQSQPPGVRSALNGLNGPIRLSIHGVEGDENAGG